MGWNHTNYIRWLGVWGKYRQVIGHSLSDMQIFLVSWSSSCLDKLTIAIMSKRRRMISQNGLSLATLSSIWHKSRNRILTIWSKYLTEFSYGKHPFKTSKYFIKEILLLVNFKHPSISSLNTNTKCLRKQFYLTNSTGKYVLDKCQIQSHFQI